MKVLIGMGKPETDSEEKDGEYSEMEIENAFHSVMRAKEVEQDPKLMAEVRRFADKKKKAITSIADIKERFNRSDDETDE